jgi:hypothetical protein
VPPLPSPSVSITEPAASQGTAVAAPSGRVDGSPLAGGEPAPRTVATSRAEDPSSSAASVDQPPIPDVESSWQLPQWQYATKKARINQHQYRRK